MLGGDGASPPEHAGIKGGPVGRLGTVAARAAFGHVYSLCLGEDFATKSRVKQVQTASRQSLFPFFHRIPLDFFERPPSVAALSRKNTNPDWRGGLYEKTPGG